MGNCIGSKKPKVEVPAEVIHVVAVAATAPSRKEARPAETDPSFRAKALYLAGSKSGAAALNLNDKLALAMALAGGVEDRSVRGVRDRSIMSRRQILLRQESRVRREDTAPAGHWRRASVTMASPVEGFEIGRPRRAQSYILATAQSHGSSVNVRSADEAAAAAIAISKALRFQSTSAQATSRQQEPLQQQQQQQQQGLQQAPLRVRARASSKPAVGTGSPGAILRTSTAPLEDRDSSGSRKAPLHLRSRTNSAALNAAEESLVAGEGSGIETCSSTPLQSAAAAAEAAAVQTTTPVTTEALAGRPEVADRPPSKSLAAQLRQHHQQQQQQQHDSRSSSQTQHSPAYAEPSAAAASSLLDSLPLRPTPASSPGAATEAAPLPIPGVDSWGVLSSPSGAGTRGPPTGTSPVQPPPSSHPHLLPPLFLQIQPQLQPQLQLVPRRLGSLKLNRMGSRGRIVPEPPTPPLLLTYPMAPLPTQQQQPTSNAVVRAEPAGEPAGQQCIGVQAASMVLDA